MKNKIILFSIVAILASAFIGCTQRIGDFTLISTKNVDIGGKYKKLDGRFVGEDKRGEIIGIPLGLPNLKTAVDNCIENGKGELVTNAVLDFSYWTAILYGERKYTVTGDVWAKASMSDLMNNNDDLYVLRADQKGYHLVSVADPAHIIKVEYFVTK